MSRIYDALKKAESGTDAPETKTGSQRLSDALFEATHMHAGPEPSYEVGTAFAEVHVPAVPDFVDEVAVASPASASAKGLLEGRYVEWKPSSNCNLFGHDQRNATLAAEQLRRLRSRLYEIRKSEPLKKVLVSSALASEGKTFVSANLAQSLVRHSSTRVLLIDADLRKPSLHTELGAAEAPGLSDYLQGAADEAAIVQRGPIKNLSFISAGTSVADPAELIAGPRLQQLMDAAAKMFDWVVLDSPPVIPISDARVLAPHCDGVLLVVRAGTTPFDLAQKAKEEFRNSVLLGVVLNEVTEVLSYKPYYYAYSGKSRSAQMAETTA